MKKAYGKTIIVTASITMAALLALIVLLTGVMFALCPGRSGDFAYSIGYDHLASSLYYKEYTYSGDVARLYQALSVAIENKDYKRVVEYYEDFRKDDDYDKFIDYKIQCAKEENTSVLIKAGLLNEREYLERCYVNALIKRNKTKKAFNFAFNSYKADKVFTLYKTGIYALNYFTEDTYFDDVYVNETTTLRESIQNNLGILYQIFDENKNSNSELDDSYLVSLGQKIIIMAEHMNSMLDSDADSATITINNGYITGVTTVLQGIIG